MPDASSHRPFQAGALPTGWSDAFAALPAEAPPAGGWERIVPALPVRRRRWPALVALAAALALVAVVPLRWSRQDAPATSMPVASAPTTTEPVGVAATQTAPAVAVEPVPVDSGNGSPAKVDAGSPPAAAIAAREDTGAPAGAVQPVTTRPVDHETTDATRVAATDAARQEPVEPAAASQELERLYAESAQLEGLLALARDGGGEVANGAVAMLSDELATRVARIDAALVQPSLSGDQRLALWRERVDALRQAAAFESTQRLLAARGEQYDAMLVSID